MKTSRKRRVLLRTAAASIPCHLFKPWSRRLRALPRPQAPDPFSGLYKNKQTVEHKPRCFRNQTARVQLCCYGRSIFKCLRLARWEAAPLGLSSLEASSVFSRKPAASSWLWGTGQGVQWERSTHAMICSIKDKYNQHRLCLHCSGLDPRCSPSTERD